MFLRFQWTRLNELLFAEEAVKKWLGLLLRRKCLTIWVSQQQLCSIEDKNSPAQHEYERESHVWALAEDRPASPEVSPVRGHSRQAWHQEETGRWAGYFHVATVVYKYCVGQDLLLTISQSSLNKESSSIPPLETSWPTQPSGSQISVWSKRPTPSGPLSSTPPTWSTNPGGEETGDKCFINSAQVMSQSPSSLFLS